jgi:ABC-2 type transport system permease protein
MKYLLPGSIALAMFVSVMIGGGMLYIDDKARGVHEGYLVTPITKAELVFGLNLAGAIKAVMTGVVITLIGSLIAGVGSIFNPSTILGLALMILLTSIAFNAMMFLLMVRVEDPLVPRATFGILNTLLFFPSGSVYPIQAFPRWLQYIARIDPPTERNRLCRDLAGHAVFDGLRDRSAGNCRAAVQANAVRKWLVVSGQSRASLAVKHARNIHP